MPEIQMVFFLKISLPILFLYKILINVKILHSLMEHILLSFARQILFDFTNLYVCKYLFPRHSWSNNNTTLLHHDVIFSVSCIEEGDTAAVSSVDSLSHVGDLKRRTPQ